MSDVTRILSAIEQGDPHAAGQILGITMRTADRLWAFARAWLHRELTDSAADPQS